MVDAAPARHPGLGDLTSRPSFLRIHGGQSPVGRQRPSLVARRVTSKQCELTAHMHFKPANYRQLAGITAYYNTRNWHHAFVTADDDGLPVLEVHSCDNGRRTMHDACRIELPGLDEVTLRVTFDGPRVTFAYHLSGPAGWVDLPAELDATILSDEYTATFVDGEPEGWGFTGAFVGLWVQDLGAEGAVRAGEAGALSTRDAAGSPPRLPRIGACDRLPGLPIVRSPPNRRGSVRR